MSRDAAELARRLARDAEAVCRHYLSNGRRQGRYWTWAMFATHPAGRCSFGSADRNPVPVPPGIGPMPPRPNMGDRHSFARFADLALSGVWPRRSAASVFRD